MPRSGIATTPSPITATDRPARRTGWVTCERCNYAKEAPGWQVTAGDDENGVHTAEFVTPTGHHYHSTAPPAPGPILVHVSEIETRIGIAIANRTPPSYTDSWVAPRNRAAAPSGGAKLQLSGFFGE